MRGQSDLDINRRIRSVLVRHWVDLGKLSIRSSAGKVLIHGSLERIGGMKEELTVAIVEVIFADIKRIPTVRQVNAAIENWSNDTGRWHPVKKGVSKA